MNMHIEDDFPFRILIFFEPSFSALFSLTCFDRNLPSAFHDNELSSTMIRYVSYSDTMQLLYNLTHIPDISMYTTHTQTMAFCVFSRSPMLETMTDWNSRTGREH